MPLCGHVIDPDDPTSLKAALPERAEIVDIFAQIGRDLPQFGKSYYRIFDGFFLLFAVSGFFEHGGSQAPLLHFHVQSHSLPVDHHRIVRDGGSPMRAAG